MAIMQATYRTHRRIAPLPWSGQSLEGPGWTIMRQGPTPASEYKGVEPAKVELKAEEQWKNPCALCPLPQNRALALYKPARDYFA